MSALLTPEATMRRALSLVLLLSLAACALFGPGTPHYAVGVAASRLVRAGRGQANEDPGVASRRVDITVASAS